MTSSNASNLSSPKYGYDFVVATTQASINSTMKDFLSTRTEPTVTVCYIADPTGKPVRIDYTELKKRANNSDPFNVPNGTDVSVNADLRNLYGARFMMGFRARLGLPRATKPVLPDIVVLGSDTSGVQFNMLCSEFTVVQLEPGNGWAGPSWTNISQSPNEPWVFTSKVDLRLSTVDGSAYSGLPPDVQKQIQNLGSQAFSVQQLLFDFTNASLMTVPQISGVTVGTSVYVMLQQYFVGAYFVQMQKESQPLLGCSIVMKDAPVSTLRLTSFNFGVNAYVNSTGQEIPKPTPEQKQLATLNYLCAANNHSLPPPVKFSWNWVDASQVTDHDGIISINRNTFANYFQSQLMDPARKCCILPSVRVYLTDPFNSTVNYSWSLAAGQEPKVNSPATGKTVLALSYDSGERRDTAGAGGDMGEMMLRNTYNITVDFSGTTIVVTQHLVCYMYVRVFQTGGSGNLVDKTITDTYDISINASGQLGTTQKSVPKDSSYSPSVDGALNFFTNFNDISNSVRDKIREFTASRLQDMPISAVQNYVFPGGKTFLYKNVGFSDYQDLVAMISYKDSSGHATVAPREQTVVAVASGAPGAQAANGGV